MSIEVDQVLASFDFDRVAVEFKARGWTYGLDIPRLGMIEYIPDAEELERGARSLLREVIGSKEPGYFIETGRFWAGRVDGKLSLRCTGVLGVAVGPVPMRNGGQPPVTCPSTKGGPYADYEPLTRKQISRLYELLRDIEGALRFKRGFRWGEGVRVAETRLLKRAGVVLLTRTALEKLGLEPKRGVLPVGTGYFGAPLKVHAELYVLGVQTRKKAAAVNPPVFRDGEASATEPQRRRRPHGA